VPIYGRFFTEAHQTNGLRTFVLALQLPYFSFVSLPENFSGGQFWKDVSFLQAPSSTSNGPRALCRSHFAFVIHGHSDRRWTAYAFSKNGLGSLEGGDYGYADFHEDPIALGKLNANSPIYDAREYFVRILEVWIGQISELCKKVIQRTERQISSYVSHKLNSFIRERTDIIQRSISPHAPSLRAPKHRITEMKRRRRRMNGLRKQWTLSIGSYLT